MSDPVQFAQSLLQLLEAEFEALKTQNLDRFEQLQADKTRLLDQLAQSQVPDQTPPTQAWLDFQDTVARCRDAHRRNETLMQHQLNAIRGTLQALRADAGLESVEVYDKLGHMHTRLGGRGYQEA